MVKYKLTFKGTDGYTDHLDKIVEFLKKKYPNAQVTFRTRDRDDIENKVYYIYVHIVYKTSNLIYEYMYWPSDNSIRKRNDFTDDYIDMDRDELKFFDSLDMQLLRLHTQATGQEVTDWWSNKSFMIDVYKFKKELKEFYHDTLAVPFSIVDNDLKYKDAIVVNWTGWDSQNYKVIIDMKDRRIEKVTPKSFEPFYPEELTFFKQYGFTLKEMFADATGQTI